uniref:Mediator of RNA polymerase II transcription subunit 8 n=1 Tax=Clastoptera arizonana TaxID=38151 RepID=A0A1B6BX70_9HEMI
MMAREEKQLESALDAIIQRVNDLKGAIAAMIFKLEHEYETLNWPAFLDNFALISGQLTALSKRLTHDKSPQLSNLTVLPLLLNPERDEELARMTEHRVTTFAHDLVPDYLRTKPEPDVETKISHLELKASSLSFEATQKQLTAYSKVVSHVWEIVSKAREEWESEGGARAGAAQTSSVTDTHALVAAVAMGKGLKVMVPQGVQPNVPQGMMVAPVGPPGGPMNPNQPPQMGPMGKAPSGIKTNIKAATQIHPYGR